MAAEPIGTNPPDGMVIGASATEKVAFYGGTPVVQQSTAATATDAATTLTLANALKVALDNLAITA